MPNHAQVPLVTDFRNARRLDQLLSMRHESELAHIDPQNAH